MGAPGLRSALIPAAVLVAAAATAPPARAQWLLDLPQDYLRLKVNERRLEHRRAELQADLDRGDAAAVGQDLQRVRRSERKVETDRWFLRGDVNPLATFTTHPKAIPPVSPNPAPTPHPRYPGYGTFPSDPTHLYRLSPSAPPVPVAPAAPARGLRGLMRRERGS